MGVEEVAHQKAINAWFGNNGNEELEANFNDGWHLNDKGSEDPDFDRVSAEFAAGWKAKTEFLESQQSKPTLKDLEDFNPDTSTGRVLDFASKKKEIEEKEDETKSRFDVVHDLTTLYFKMRSCGPGVHC